MSPAGASPELGRLARSLTEAKRLRRTGRDGTATARAFSRAWAALAAGVPTSAVADRIAADALVLCGVGDLEPDDLAASGVDLDDLARRAATEDGRPPTWLVVFDGTALHQAPRHRPVSSTVDTTNGGATQVSGGDPWPVPSFCAGLATQPRAGAVGAAGRRCLPDTESHADHCFAVAALATLAAIDAGTPEARGEAAAAALAHHLHNATFPDLGWRGEELLGPEALIRLVDRHRATALDELTAAARAVAERGMATAAEDATGAAADAFVVGDVVDRVAEAAHHAAVASITVDQQLEGDLVHPGPLRDTQLAVIAAAGLVTAP